VVAPLAVQLMLSVGGRVLSDAPEAPENLQASDVHADHLKLSWLPPSDDGGSDITGQCRRQL